MIWAEMLVHFGHKYDKSVIPKNIQYCYTPLKYENNVYRVKPCPYYKTLGKTWDGCKFLGLIAKDDLLLSDQCKICGISNGYDEDMV